MRAIRVHELEGPDAVRVDELDEPGADGNLLVDVAAAGVAFPDVLMTRGLYQYKPDPPFILGAELAGLVREAPEDSGFAAGDRVMAFAFGSFCEVAAVPAMGAFKLPEGLTLAEGAAFVLNYHTAHFGLIKRGEVSEGQTVLVHGAAGGVGSAALQVAKALGARTIGVVSSDEKERVAREAGADEVVRSHGDWRGAVKEITGGAGVNVVYDPVGGDRMTDSLRSLAEEGRVVVIGFTEGSIPQVAVNRLLLRNVSVVGAGWGAFALTKPDYVRECAADLERMVAEGFVKPIVSRTYPLEEAAAALREIDERRALGKLVLDVNGKASE